MFWLEGGGGMAIFSLGLPDLLFTCLMVLPDDFLSGRQTGVFGQSGRRMEAFDVSDLGHDGRSQHRAAAIHSR